MLFCQVWIARRATRSNLAKPQTFPLENPRGSNSGLRFPLVFWMSLHKDYPSPPKNVAIELKRGVSPYISLHVCHFIHSVFRHQILGWILNQRTSQLVRL